MWILTVLALASGPAVSRTVTVDGEVFGPRRSMTCTWFTNFETSRFDQCREGGRALLRDGDGATVACARATCARMDAAARRAARWRRAEPPWGRFTVHLSGRLARDPHPRRFLGDATMTVLVEAIAGVRPAR